ncbi:hypothetical protein BC629DRAFT_1546161 [Irpex lacteus]|nr:hypothetical protein BC629DRAFT_1546161 [Irpex lacteus]
MPKAPADRQPRLQRNLPEGFLNAVGTRRAEGRPVRWTDRDIEAIVAYVSRRPRLHPLGTRLPPFDYNEHRERGQRITQRVRQERAQSLADRIEKPSLRDRISNAPAPAPPTPIAPKPALVDFAKLSIEDRAGALRPRLDATIRRLTAVIEVLDELPIKASDQKVIRDHYNHLLYVRDTLSQYVNRSDTRTLTTLSWGLKQVGFVSFKNLRNDINRVVSDLKKVFEGGYWELEK